MHLETDWLRELDKQMARVTCRDLDPARGVSAHIEISRVQREHTNDVPVPRRDKSPYRMGREECPYPRWRRQSLSVGGVECPYRKRREQCPYPKRTGEGPWPERRGGCLPTCERRAECLAPHMEMENPKFT